MDCSFWKTNQVPMGKGLPKALVPRFMKLNLPQSRSQFYLCHPSLFTKGLTPQHLNFTIPTADELLTQLSANLTSALSLSFTTCLCSCFPKTANSLNSRIHEHMKATFVESVEQSMSWATMAGYSWTEAHQSFNGLQTGQWSHLARNSPMEKQLPDVVSQQEVVNLRFHKQDWGWQEKVMWLLPLTF